MSGTIAVNDIHKRIWTPSTAMKLSHQSIVFLTTLLLAASLPAQATVTDDQAIVELQHRSLTQNCTRTMVSPTSETVSGTVTYRERIALPPDAIVRVTLESVSSPTEVIAEQTIKTQGRQVPIPFSLNYDAESIHEEDSYLIRAQILVDNQLRFAGDADYPTSPSEKLERVVVIVRSIHPNPR